LEREVPPGRASHSRSGNICRIRNVATHTDEEWTEQVALEHLAVPVRGGAVDGRDRAHGIELISGDPLLVLRLERMPS
jgi:hypothetical protein